MSSLVFRRRFAPALLATTLLVAVAGCSDDASTTAPGADPRDPSTIPLLPEGLHVSLITTFEPLSAAVGDSVDARWGEALAAGMRVGRIHLDWASVEPDSGQVDRAVLRDALVAMREDGLLPLVALYAMDTEGVTLPADLAARFAAGLDIDAPAVLARYHDLLDWAVPMIVEHGGWGLILANENDGYMIDHPAKVDNVARFYRAARERVHALAPGLAVTATHTMDGPLGAPHYRALIEELDFASFNYYPLTAELFVYEPTRERIASDLSLILAAAAGRPVILQELGCPAGYAAGSSMGATASIQEAFFTRAFDLMAREPRIRAAFVFQLVDWSPALIDRVYGGILDAEGLPQPFIDRFTEWLATTGFITHDDGSRRPAWSAFVAAIAAGDAAP